MATDDGVVLDIRIAECVHGKTIKPDGNLMACSENPEVDLAVPEAPGEYPEVWEAENWPSDTTDARDGRDLSACYDLECQVTVVEGDTIEQSPNSGIASFTITKITSKKVTLRISGEEYSTEVGSTLGGGLDGKRMATYSPLLADDGTAVLDIRVVACIDGLYPMPSGDRAECLS